MTDTDERSQPRNDNRVQPRIRAQVQIEIRNPRDGSTRRALLSNLSWGGALIWCEVPPGAPGDEVEVRLPYKPAEPIAIESEILRVDREADRYVVAVRFTSVTTHDESHLEKVLEMLLSGQGGGRRQHPRLTQRLEIYFDDPADVRATLEDISRGGLGVTVPYSFSVNQSVQLTIYGGPGIGELSLRARVVHQSPVQGSDTGLFRVGLKLEHPAKDLHDLVERLLRRMGRSQALASGHWQGRRGGGDQR